MQLFACSQNTGERSAFFFKAPFIRPELYGTCVLHGVHHSCMLIVFSGREADEFEPNCATLVHQLQKQMLLWFSARLCNVKPVHDLNCATFQHAGQ